MSTAAPAASSSVLLPLAPSTSSSVRPGKLSILTTHPVVAESAVPSPRTPRRESAKMQTGGRSKAAAGGGGVHSGKGGPNNGVNQAPGGEGSAAAHGAGGASTDSSHGHGPATSSSSTSGDAASSGSSSTTSAPHAKKATASSSSVSRWGLLRKSVQPNPALMKVNEKVLQIIHTLRKLPEDRTESDIKLLFTWLMNQEKLSSLFTTMSEISAKKLCKEMEFLHLASGQVVVNQGDKGNTCFILVSGLVSVYVRNAEEQQKYFRVARSSVDGFNSKRLMEQGQLTFGAKVATLMPGATFGELCLIEPDSKRSATVTVDAAAQVANFIVLSAASYLRMTRSQTIEGTITDHIAFLQHMLLFSKWTKMQLMHLVNSMKLLSVPAGQYLTHKGADADSFFVLLRGEAQECVRLMLNENSEMSVGDNRGGAQHCVTVELTFLGKFDVAGEYLAAEKKVVACPVDIRAVSDVDCLVLNRKLFNLHFSGKELKKHASRALKKLRTIASQRQMWRETRIDQALCYPNLRVPITRKLMRLSGNGCMICGRDTHIAGDELCMELATYHMKIEKKKKKTQEKERETRAMSKHRISIVVPSQAQAMVQAALAKSQLKAKNHLPALKETGDDDDDEDDDDEDDEDSEDGRGASRSRSGLGHRLVKKQWKAAEQAGLTRPPQPQRPRTTPQLGGGGLHATKAGRDLRITSITHTQHVSRRKLLLEQQKRSSGGLHGDGSIHGNQQHGDPLSNRNSSFNDEIRRIRESWPYAWQDLEPMDDKAATNHFERLYRNTPRTTTASATSPTSSPPRGQKNKKPHTAR